MPLRWTWLALALMVSAGSNADTIENLVQALDSVSKESAQTLNPDKSPALRAIDALETMGSPEAVAALANYLRKDDGYPHIKRQALMALGRIGSEAATTAIAEFETWAEARPKHWYEVTVGVSDHPSYHYSPYVQNTLTETNATDGSVYVLFAAPVYTPADLWIGTQGATPGDLKDIALLTLQSPDRKTLEELRLANRVKLAEMIGEPDSFQIYLGDSRPYFFSFEQLRLDTDNDGLSDVRERRMGTSLAHPDSDGDGVPDGKDGNPLTPPLTTPDDAAAIRQAVFLTYYGVTDSHFALYQTTNEQEYIGYSGPVLFVPLVATGSTNFFIEVTEVQGDTAAVNFKDYQQPLSAGWGIVDLRKVHGRWVVIGERAFKLS